MDNRILFRHSKPPKLMSVWIGLFLVEGVAVASKITYNTKEEAEKACSKHKEFVSVQEIAVLDKYNNGPRYTFAGVVEEGKIRIGMSRCSANDKFNKKRGRTIATGRANELPLITSKIPVFETKEEEKEFRLGRMFYQITEELIERLDNGYIKVID